MFVRFLEVHFLPVLQIWIRIGPDLLPGSRIIVPDPNPAKSERADKSNCEYWTVCIGGL